MYKVAEFFDEANNPREALVYVRKATSAVLAHAKAETLDTRQTMSAGLTERRSDYFVRHVAALSAAARAGLAPAGELAREAFEIGQFSTQSAAAKAVQQVGARAAAGSGPVAELARESQDLAARWRDSDKRLLQAVSKPEAEQDSATIHALREEITRIDSRLDAIAAQQAKDFPDYAALLSPQPLKVEDTQKLLGPDEGLVFWVAAPAPRWSSPSPTVLAPSPAGPTLHRLSMHAYRMLIETIEPN